MSQTTRPNHTALIEPDTLPDMLKRAWEGAGYVVHSITVSDDEVVTCPDGPDTKSVVRGEGHARVHEPVVSGTGMEILGFEFEVNVGTHKDDLVVLDEVEVVLDWADSDVC